MGRGKTLQIANLHAIVIGPPANEIMSSETKLGTAKLRSGASAGLVVAGSCAAKKKSVASANNCPGQPMTT